MSQTKRVYLFDAFGLYTGAYDAQQDPKNPGAFISPLNSTDIEPVLANGQWPVFEDSKWVNKEDFRGVAWDTTTGEPVSVRELGPLADNLTKTPKPIGTCTWVDGAWVVQNDPNIPTFIEEVKTDLGGIVSVNTLMRDYPALFPAIQSGNWVDVKALIIDAAKTNVLTVEQYNAINASAQTNFIPLELPAL